MGYALKSNHYYSLEEYETIVKQAKEGERYEYADGQIIAFTDEYTTTDHNQVVQNAADLLKAHFYPQDCRVYTENVRLVIEQLRNHRLPDVMVTCAEKDRQSKDKVSNPVVLVEVLSPATAMSDLAVKADIYRKIDSLQAYLIINPAEVWVRVYERNEAGEWLPDVSYHDLNDTIRLVQLGLVISVKDLYRFVC